MTGASSYQTEVIPPIPQSAIIGGADTPGAKRLGCPVLNLEGNYKIVGHTLTFSDYGDGLVEYGYALRYGLGAPRLNEQERVSISRDYSFEANQRARRAIRRAVMARKLDYMITLTYRDNMQDRKQAVSDLQKFISSLRSKIGNFVWLAVPEKQKRGAWHWHIAVKGWQNIEIIRHVWKYIVGEGSVNVRAPKKGSGNPRWDRVRIAYYISKYISKDEDTNKGDMRYYRDRKQGEVMRLKLSFDKYFDLVKYIRNMYSAMGLSIRQEFADTFGGWGCSWDHPYRKEKITGH